MSNNWIGTNSQQQYESHIPIVFDVSQATTPDFNSFYGKDCNSRFQVLSSDSVGHPLFSRPHSGTSFSPRTVSVIYIYISLSEKYMRAYRPLTQANLEVATSCQLSNIVCSQPSYENFDRRTQSF